MAHERLRLCAVGDTFLGDTTVNLGRGVRASIQRNGMNSFISAISPFFTDCDLGFCNLECVLSDHNLKKWKIDSVEMRGKPEFGEILSKSGINVANVANNHMFQHGEAAFVETLSALQAHGIQVLGEEDVDGGSKLVLVERKGIRVGFVGYSLHYEQYQSVDRCPYALRDQAEGLVKEIREIRKRFEGPLVCSLHWGHEFVDRPSISQQRLARRLIDEGVLLVLGHHSHTLQGIEEYGNGLIAYSLGNFVFDSRVPEQRETIALVVDMDKDGIVGSEALPVVINDSFQPERPPADLGRRILETLQELSSSLEPEDLETDEDLEKLSRQLYRTYRWNSIRKFIQDIYRYNPLYSTQIVSRFILRKVGLAHDP